MANLIEKVEDFLKEYDLCDKTLVVGFSGGYDSMCLLDILSKIKNVEGFYNMKVIAAHFNHNWRGAESLQEQEVCRLFASSCGFEFVTKTAPYDLKKTENDARIARYEFFEDIYDDYDADAVLTAHNKDDNAETVLYRAIKGTGLYGLKGISVKRNYFYRPLLKVSRAEILEYCDSYNLSPNNDSSNMNPEYNRNYLRLRIIPALEKINPSVKDALNTLAEVARSEDAIIEEYISQFRDKVLVEDGIDVNNYKTISAPVKMRFIHEYMRKFDLDYDFKRIKELYDFIESNINKRNGSTISLTNARWLYADEKIVEVIPKMPVTQLSEKLDELEITVSETGEYEFGERIVSIKEYKEKEVFVFPDSTANFVYVDLSDIALPLTIRTRKEGDIISPFGMTGSMKLKKYLNSKGIPRHKRDEIVLVASGEEILWVSGVGLSSKVGVTSTPTHVIEVRDK